MVLKANQAYFSNKPAIMKLLRAAREERAAGERGRERRPGGLLEGPVRQASSYWQAHRVS